MPGLMPEAIPNDQDAFCSYLQHHAPHHVQIFSEMLGLRVMQQDPLFRQYDSSQFFWVNFDKMLNSDAEALAMGRHFGFRDTQTLDAYKIALTTNAKTKASGIRIDREALWSGEANELYARLNCDAIVARMTATGLNF